MPDPNVISSVRRVFVSNVPAAPGAGETAVLFATHPGVIAGVTVAPAQVSKYQHGADPAEVTVNPDALEELEVTWTKHDQASAVNGLKAFKTHDGGQTWDETDMKGYVGGVADQPTIGSAAPIQIPALAAGQEWSEQFDVGRYRGFALVQVAGAVGPTPTTGWQVTISAKYSEQGE